MSSIKSSSGPGLPTAQVFVLRVPGGDSAAMVEHVNGGVISRHGTLHEAFARIQALLSPTTPRTPPDRRH